MKILNQESNVKENMFRLFMPSPLRIHGIGILTYLKTILKKSTQNVNMQPSHGWCGKGCMYNLDLFKPPFFEGFFSGWLAAGLFGEFSVFGLVCWMKVFMKCSFLKTRG